MLIKEIKQHLNIKINILLLSFLFICSVKPLWGFDCDSSEIDIPRSECLDLNVFYTSTNGVNWTNNSGWAYGTHPCWAEGLSCNGGHIVYLSLYDHNLSGNIPSEIGSLTMLERLNLADNHLTGAIPAEIGNLTNLNYLSLYKNNLSGNIPSVLGNLVNLKILWLDINELHGSIPNTIGNLINLQNLGMSNNQLSGIIPFEVAHLGASLSDDCMLSANPSSLWIPNTPEYQAIGKNPICGIPLTDSCCAVDFSVSSYEMGNISTKADEFTVWADFRGSDGHPRTDICESYGFFIVGDADKGALQVKCDHLASVHPGWYRITFEVDKDAQYPSAAFFKNGTIVAFDWYTNEYFPIYEIPLISVYGSTFSMKKDAFEFENGSWRFVWGNIVKSSNYKYADTINTFLAKDSRKGFWEAVGNISSYSTGLCFGMASAAIANFNHKTLGGWGLGTITNWKDQIKGHWNSAEKHAISPFKPFNKYSRPNGGIFDLSSKKSLKKIMYYFVAQPFYYRGVSTNSWIGKMGDDNSDWISPVNKQGENDIAIFLQKGTPLLTAFWLPKQNKDNRSGHAIVLTQLIQFGNHSTYAFYDNNFPYGSVNNSYGPFLSRIIKNNTDYLNKNAKKYSRVLGFLRKDGTGRTDNYKLDDILDDFGVLKPGCSDSENVYGLWDETCHGLTQKKLLKEKRTQQKTPSSKYNRQSIAPYHHDIIVIGGGIDGVYPQGSSTPTSLVPNGDVTENSCVIRKSMGGTFNQLFLPASGTYKIEATKEKTAPFLKIFVTIPNGDGTVQELNYEHAELSETDTTSVYFIVGKNNNDLAIHRLTGSTCPADYNDTHDIPLPAPSAMHGFTAFGQGWANEIRLSWENPQDVRFSHVILVRRTERYPTTPVDGDQIYAGNYRSFTDTTASANTLYYYSLFSVDTSGNHSNPIKLSLDTSKWAFVGSVLEQNNLQGITTATVSVFSETGQLVGTCHPLSDGSYSVPNLPIGTYTVSVKAPGYTFTDSPQTYQLVGNGSLSFMGSPVPMLKLIYDFKKIPAGQKVLLGWKFLHIGGGTFIKIQKNINGLVTDLATVAASKGYFNWDITDPVTNSASLTISLANNPSVKDTDSFSIVPKVKNAYSSFPWTMFLPAIIGSK